MMQRRELLLASFGILGRVNLAEAAESVPRRKLNLLEQDLAPAGWVTFSAKEVNTLAAEEIPKQGITGVTRPYVELGRNSAIGSARIDFARIRESSGEPPGPLVRLLGGEKDVSVAVNFRSSAGTVQIDVTRVTINGLAIEGRLLDWLVENYLLPLYPTAKIGKPFEIGFHVEHIEVSPARVRLRIVR